MSRKKSPTKSFLNHFFEKSSYKDTDSPKPLRTTRIKDNSSFTKTNLKMTSGLLHEKIPIIPSGNKREFSTYTVHSRLGKIESMSGELYQLDNVNSRQSISKEKKLALTQIEPLIIFGTPSGIKINNYKKPQGELVLYLL
jgi:hypothetical protein